jgi:TolB-like protein
MGQSQEKQQNREKFRNSLTEEQIAILGNKEMKQNQKRKTFMNSLTEQQCNMLQENQELRQQQRNEFRNDNASGEQSRQMIQNGTNTRNSAGKNGNGQL